MACGAMCRLLLLLLAAAAGLAAAASPGMSAADMSGPLYIRWGRRSCPDTAFLIYEGDI